ncbi:putative phage related protein [Lactococcus cremoris subsp. cremoris GE214]|nr:putative phage related protein [Lactococcus cremoris subsp. cremoris GE214]
MMDNKRISEIVDEEMIKQDANRYRDMRKILTIPKSIADELDDIFNEFVRIKNSRSIWGLLWRAEEIDDETRMRLEWLLPDENQVNIAVAYLAGKALGVDLVKVVEG